MLKWTDEQLDFLLDNYLTMTNTEIAAKIGRNKTSVRNKLSKLNLRRPPEVRRKLQLRTAFKIGQRPWNKGKKGYRVSPETEFKKGHKPHNTKYDGCITIRIHKRTGTPYKYIRVAEGEWMLYHHYVWQERHGKIPPKHCIRFKDRNTLNCNIDNLTLISQEENCRLNTNRAKQKQSMRKVYLASDRYVANLITRDNDLKRDVIKCPELLALKRLEITHRRRIDECAK